ALTSALLLLASYRLVAVQGNFYDLPFALLLATSLVFALRVVENWKWVEGTEAPITFFAGYSYTLYLTHYTVMTAMRSLDGMALVLTVTAAANLLAIAMWWLFERHHRAVASALKTTLRRAAFPIASEAAIEHQPARML